MGIEVGPSAEGEETAMSEINVVPLTDVMLVLLIIFLIAVPVVIQTVPVELPKVEFEPTTTKPENVSLSVRGDGAGGCEVYWNLQRVDNEQLLDMAVDNLEKEVERQERELGRVEDLPEAHIRGDVDTPYKCIGGAIYVMQRAGFPRVGFISEPEPGGNVQRFDY